MKLRFLGAAGTVTGSKYLVEAKGSRVLVDCGLFQGWKQLRLRNWEAFPVDVRSIDAVCLTHAHLDHSGFLPCLWRQGYRGPVYSSRGTMDLCRLLLPDAGRLQEEDAEYANRKRYSKHSPALPLFTEEEAHRSLELFRTVEFDREVPIGPAFSARWLPAGHIVGAASVYLRAEEKTILFSGDIGRGNDLVMDPPAPPRAADVVVIESTYGGRLHPKDDAISQLAEAIRRTFNRNGVVIIPAFSVGRTQAILYALHLLKKGGKLRGAPVFLDSPMSISAVEIYSRYSGNHKLSEEECAGMCDVAQYARTVEDSIAIQRKHGPMVIISASGMATGGRVLHHLKKFAPDPRNLILFAGYQAGGTRGSDLIRGSRILKIHGERISVNAEVAMLDGLSAHADQEEILAWLEKLPAPPRNTYVTHGEPEGSSSLEWAIQERLGWQVDVAQHMQEVEIK